jgi:hypothetical protein
MSPILFLTGGTEIYYELHLNGMMVLAREKDGYINATQMCKAGGQLFSRWKVLESTTALIKILESDAGIPASLLIESVKGNSTKFAQGSWVHPDLAVHLLFLKDLKVFQLTRKECSLLLTTKPSF